MFLNSKRGSIFVEATIIMPLTISISVAMILLAVHFHGQLLEQAKTHKKEIEEKSYNMQLEMGSWYESFF